MACPMKLYFCLSLNQLKEKAQQDWLDNLTALKTLDRARLYLQETQKDLEKGDEEMAYLFLFRFYNAIARVRKSYDYSMNLQDLESRIETLSGAFDDVVKKFEGLEKKLEQRYKELDLRPNADFHLVACNGTKMSCHKAVLAEKSPFFRSMLQSGMQEQVTGEAILPFSEGCVRAIVRCLYNEFWTDSIFTSELAAELIHAGTIYEIPRMKKETIKLLQNKRKGWITIETAIWLFKNGTQVESRKQREIAVKALSTKNNKDMFRKSLYKKLPPETRQALIQALKQARK